MPTDRARIMPTDRARIMPTDRAPALSGLPRRAGSRAQCTCDVGYGGTECSFACPTFYDQPCGCSDPTLSTCRGTCSSSDGTCACKSSYRGVNCGILCLGGPTNTCSRHGTCAGDGSCMCNPGWTGSMCEIECPGGWQKPCSGHGICSAQGKNSSRCDCDTGLEGLVGSYQGVSCEKAILNENIRVENSENETLHGMRETRSNALCPLSKTLLPILALPREKRPKPHTDLQHISHAISLGSRAFQRTVMASRRDSSSRCPCHCLSLDPTPHQDLQGPKAAEAWDTGARPQPLFRAQG